MKRGYLSLGLLFGLAVIVLYVMLSRPKKVTLILERGNIYTVNDRMPHAEAIAIDGDRIAAVGTTAEVRSSFTADSIVDLKWATVFPGFIDSHAHLEGIGAALMSLNLSGTRSIGQIQDLVAGRVRTSDREHWIRGRGWDQNAWADKSFPTHEPLDAVAPDVPVYLTRVDGHAVWVNRKVLEMAKIDRSSHEPEGGKIVRDAAGNPTGVFIDNAIDMLNGVLPPPSLAERTAAYERAIQECIGDGLTEVHDMGVDLQGIGIYKELIREGKFPFRVYVAINGLGETWEHFLKSGPEIGGYDGRLTVRALKLYADGALGSRGAALIEPYSDDPLNRGLTLTSADVLREASQKALAGGFQVCVHAIGDRANNIVLNVYEQVLKAVSVEGKDVRFRVEHAQVVDATDIPRFHALGVLPMMQTTHCTSDMYWAEARLGPRRISGAYAWRSLLNAGSIIPGGSDAPVESPNPLWGFYAAITRQDRTGWPQGGWYPEQRMTREEALKSFTLWGAYAGFEESKKGSLEKGKLADLVVLTNDIMKVPPEKILETSVMMTMVAGKFVYTAETPEENSGK